MKVTSNHRYAASPDVVFAVMTTPEVLIEKYNALGHHDVTILEHSVTGPEGGGGVTVRSRRKVPMQVPGFAKRFLEPENTVEQHDCWSASAANGTRTGTWQVSARGVPVKVGGTLRLARVEGGTEVEITGEVSCSVPLVGGKLASLVGADVELTIRGEEEFNDHHLARQKPKKAAKPKKKPAPPRRSAT